MAHGYIPGKCVTFMPLTRGVEGEGEGKEMPSAGTPTGSGLAMEPWHDVARGRYLKDLIYAASDGIVTTFAVVAGATGANLSSTVIIILGFANLLADGFSMAVADYLGTRSEIEYYEREREREIKEVEETPEVERGEVRQIFRAKGLSLALADRLSEIISSDKKVWVDIMMTEELGLMPSGGESPFRGAISTFLAFVAAGFMPLVFFTIPYTFSGASIFDFSVLTTAMSLFIVGAIRTRLTKRNWLRSGLEVLLAGGAAAAVAYLSGFLLKAIVG